MGDEIQYSHFKRHDYARFEDNLHKETLILRDLFENKSLSNENLVAGYELEAWLIDSDAKPCPHNELLLEKSNNPLLSPELAKFNIELNAEPAELTSSVLSNFESTLLQLWQHCSHTLKDANCNLLGIGILPTLQDSDLTLSNISTLDRYKALNEQVLKQRHGEEIHLSIVGKSHLESRHMDVMLEAAATSLQIHTQVPQDLAVRYYNASMIVTAPIVATAANSPCLFGHDLWEETRIPVFEQAVPAGGINGAAHGPVQRVSFGTSYAKASIFECFLENEQHFPVLLPVAFDSRPEELRYLRLHNGTIWRWNRPLVGFDDNGDAHLRIEHRSIASAPSIVDNIANIAFYFGLAYFYSHLTDAGENSLAFSQTRNNFYTAAQHGLDAHIEWVDNKRYCLKNLILDQLLIEAETGLVHLKIQAEDIKKYLGVIEQRVRTGQTGSQWQRHFLSKNENDFTKMTHAYYAHQQTNTPGHTWSLS